MPRRPLAKQVPRPWESRQRYWWLAGLAVLYSGLIYVNALNNPYVYDDVRTIQGNTSLDDISQIKRVVLRERMRPLVNISYALDRIVWPWRLVGHHLTSVLLHALDVLLIFQLAWVATIDQREHAPPGAGARAQVSAPVVAFLSASLFGLHPMQTEAVGYISGRSEVLYAAFFLLALLSARRWMKGEGLKWLGLSIALWGAALTSKEVAVFWPVIALLYDRYVLGSPEADLRRRTWRVYMPLLGLTIAIGVARLGILLFVENPDAFNVQWKFAAVELVVWAQYFRLLLLPVGQSIFHQVDPVNSIVNLRFLLSAAWLIAWLTAAFKLRRVNGMMAVGMFWFVLLLIPSSMLVLLDLGEPMSEHRAYLSSAGLFMMVGAGLGWAWAYFGTERPSVRLRLRVLIAMWLTVLGALTVLRNDVWSSPVRLWLDAVTKGPDVWLPHMLLGEALHEAGSIQESMDEYRMASRLQPAEPLPWMKLGLTLAELHRLDEAAGVFQQLEQRTGGSALARNGLGAVALLAGRTDEAREHYRSALAVSPNDVAARQSLALIAETIDHDPATALALCQQVQEIAPETPGNDDCIRRNQAAAGAPAH